MSSHASTDTGGGSAPAVAHTEDEKLLAALALALIDKPRATLHELAVAVGVSKATLYRHSRTREELIDRLTLHATECMQRTLNSAKLEAGTALEALSRFIGAQLDQREMTAGGTAFACWSPENYS